MSFLTIEHPNHLNRNSLSRQDTLGSHNLNVQIGLRTISNCFFTPDKIPQSVEEPREYRSGQKPFFTKNRKAIESKIRLQKGTGVPGIIPASFKNMLRAKSTVIKQKNLQEFYINRQGRESEMQERKNAQSAKSHLLKPNFPKKRIKAGRINSISLQKSRKSQERTLERKGNSKLTSKVITIQSLTEELSEMALKQKQLHQNCASKKENNPKVHWRSAHKKPRPILDKQNLECLISPWGGCDNDDICF